MRRLLWFMILYLQIQACSLQYKVKWKIIQIPSNISPSDQTLGSFLFLYAKVAVKTVFVPNLL